ncbi:PilZ domain-containing protein [Thioalkalivibrio sp. ALJT]|uniref:PilZ domain-containing protein n=1 Tax=Thioalkalivibrio sp. ALJT TaxID=1158146 RepID=UPI00036E469F|nr:PilZ domain-containing protein [Thioalkalivibrio sp. ALJT]
MIGEEDRRDHRRMRVTTEARVTWRADGESMVVQLEDLSATGCAFVASRECGERMGLSVSVPSPDHRLDGLERRGRVVRCEPLGPGREDGWRVAVAFEAEE